MLKLHVKTLGNTAVLFLQGRIVTGETDILCETVASLAPVPTVRLDMSRVHTVDAHGLGVMLTLREQLEANGGHLELANVSELVARVFEITHLDSVFHVTRSNEFTSTTTPRVRATVLRAPRPLLASCA
jgi:anti-anti-sigma factor